MNEKIFDLWLDSKDGHIYTLTLPASDYTLLEALERLKLDPGEQPKWSFCKTHDFQFLTHCIDPSENLYALNALTRRLSVLGTGQRMVFEGLINIEYEKGQPMTLETMADITFSICCGHTAHAPALPLTPPEKPEYVFSFSLGNREGSKQTTLDLPAAQEELDAILGRLGVRGWDEVVFREEDSAIPGFLNSEGFQVDSIDDIEQLNELAEAVRRVDSAGQLTKFKAVLEAMVLTDPGEAMDLASRLDEYSLSPELRYPADVAVDWLGTSMDAATLEDLLPYLNRHDYGQHILEKHGEALTGYGLVTRCDGQPLHAETIQQGGMQMG